MFENKNRYLLKHIRYDVRTGLRQNIWLLVVYFVGTIVFTQVQLLLFSTLNDASFFTLNDANAA